MPGSETPYRLAVAGILLLNVAISARYRARARRAETIPRRAEGATLAGLRVAVALPLLLAVVTYVLAPGWLPGSVSLPAALRRLGVALGLVAAPLNAWILATLGDNVTETVLTKRAHQLVVSGPYRWVRHPLYLAGLLMLAGIALAAANGLIAAFAAVLFVFLRWMVVPREEAELGARFGKAYDAYRSTTRALLPWPAQRGTGSSGSPDSSSSG